MTALGCYPRDRSRFPAESDVHGQSLASRVSVQALCVVGTVLFLLTTARGTSAGNAGTFTRATIAQLNPWIPPIDMDIDPNSLPHDAMTYEIAPGRAVEIKVYGTAAAAGAVSLKLWDDDAEELFRGSDDELDDRGTLFPLQPGEEFVITLYCTCTDGTLEISGGDDSGEQSAEIFVSDGSKGIPKNLTLPGGGTVFTSWQIQCAKDTSQAIGPLGGSINATWGDALAFPPGALLGTTSVRMMNPLPLPSATSVPARFSSISEALTIQPDGMSYQLPAQLTFHYTREEAWETPNEHLLRALRFNPTTAAWELVAGTVVDTLNNLITLPVGGAGTYGFAAGLPPSTAIPGMTPLGAMAAAIILLVSGSAGILLRRQRADGASRQGP